MEIKSKNIKSINIDGNKGTIQFEVFEPLKPKKISSTWIPQILGLSDFSPKGDKLLEFWGFVQGEPFDKIYEVRGEIAERLVVGALEKKGFKPKRYLKDDYNYDLFQYDETKLSTNKLMTLYKYFGGLPDIAYKNEKGEINLLEVKSKDFGKIVDVENDNVYQYEIVQGRVLAMLYGVDKVHMTYVFFSDGVMRNIYFAQTSVVPYNLEKAIEIFNSRYPNGLQYGKDKDYYIIRKEHEVKKYELLDTMKECNKIAETFRQTLTVNIKDLSKELYSKIFKLEGEISDIK
jgi:hypothetical protein